MRRASSTRRRQPLLQLPAGEPAPELQVGQLRRDRDQGRSGRDRSCSSRPISAATPPMRVARSPWTTRATSTCTARRSRPTSRRSTRSRTSIRAPWTSSSRRSCRAVRRWSTRPISAARRTRHSSWTTSASPSTPIATWWWRVRRLRADTRFVNAIDSSVEAYDAYVAKLGATVEVELSLAALARRADLHRSLMNPDGDCCRRADQALPHGSGCGAGERRSRRAAAHHDRPGSNTIYVNGRALGSGLAPGQVVTVRLLDRVSGQLLSEARLHGGAMSVKSRRSLLARFAGMEPGLRRRSIGARA